MATETWVVYAYSGVLQQKVRYFNLTEMGRILTQQEAQQAAEVFAQTQNNQQYMRASDWQAHIEYESHGIDTLPGYIG